MTPPREGGAADTLLARYVVLRDRRTALWVAAWALATWCYRAFRIFPYLSIRSAEKRCGKSRLLGLLARACLGLGRVRGDRRGVDPLESEIAAFEHEMDGRLALERERAATNGS